MFFEKDFQNEYKKYKNIRNLWERILQLRISILWGELNVRNNFVSFSYVSHSNTENFQQKPDKICIDCITQD